MLVRKKFYIENKDMSTFLDITADDYYKLYINGRFVGQGPALAYYFHYYFNRYEVTEYLQEGSNVIAVEVYYQGLINRVWNSGDHRQGMIAELYTKDELHVFSDTSWKCYRAKEYVGSSTFGYETQFVEDIDCRLQLKGWKEIDFNDQGWENALEKISDDHKLVLQDTPALEVYEIKAQSVHFALLSDTILWT
jgi:alpha-L-rhamnosidase